MRDFIGLPWTVHKEYPNWVPPLKIFVRRLLDTSKHPFWKFSQQVLFLARRGRETVGRIAGIIDNHYNEYWDERAAAWGFFECLDDPEVAAMLFRGVERWAREKGMTRLRGPLNPSPNYEVGTLIEGFEYVPTIMLPYNPPYYPKLIDACGFGKERDLLVRRFEADTHEFSTRILRLTRRMRSKDRVSIRKLNMKDLRQEVRLIHEIAHECLGDHWGFVPMNDEELGDMAVLFRCCADPDLTFFIFYDGEPAGVVVILPDLNPLFKTLNGNLGLVSGLKLYLHRRKPPGIRGLLFGVKKRYHKLGIPMLLTHYLNTVVFSKNYRYMEMGWILEENTAMNQLVGACGGKVVKKYRIYVKNL